MPVLRSVNPLAAEHRVLRTRLDVAECSRRLQDEIALSGLGGALVHNREGRLLGRVGPRSFRVRRYTPGYKNSGRPEASGELIADADGTLIRVRIGQSPAFRSIALLLAVATVVAAVWSLATGYAWQPVPIEGLHTPVPFLAIVGVMVLALIVFPYGLKYVAAGEGPWLLDFLRYRLDAELADAKH